MLESLAHLLTSKTMSTWVTDVAPVWAVAEIFHYVGMLLLIGSVGLLDFRMLGFAKGLPIASLERLVPIGLIGFALNVVTGAVFVSGNPGAGALEYLTNFAFQMKMLCILLAGANVMVFYLTGVSRAAHATAPDGEAPRSAKIVAATSIVLWLCVIYFGRMIMYNDTLLNVLWPVSPQP